ncbi:MAG TPA: hypothetical protein VND65_22990 [Candidatus Binatia bacterium]|nr:hypothetical protein [Candidatus Binatia bacterium]
MRAYLTNLAPRTLMLLAIPALALGYCVVMVILPAIFNAVVPDVVRSVLSLI